MNKASGTVPDSLRAIKKHRILFLFFLPKWRVLGVGGDMPRCLCSWAQSDIGN